MVNSEGNIIINKNNIIGIEENLKARNALGL
jgi:hypothetical protein